MYARFQAGRFSIAHETLTGGMEAGMAEHIEQLCFNTYGILTERIGLNPDTVGPILDGGSVILEGEDRAIFLNHLTMAFDVERLAREHMSPEHTDPFLASWSHFLDIAKVEIHGPVVRIELDSRARDSIDSLHYKSFAGMVASIPLQPWPYDGTFDADLRYGRIPIPCIYVDVDEAKKWKTDAEPQEVDLHEWQHIFDRARTNMLVRMKHPEVSSDEYTPVERRIIRALSKKIFNPKELASTLNYLEEIEHEFIKGELPKITFTPAYVESALLTLQHEVCAGIAGRITEGYFHIRTMDGRSDIADDITKTYLPFLGSERFMHMLSEISHDTIRGHYWYYPGHDYKLVEWLKQFNLQIPEYEKRAEWGDFVISVYLNPEGDIAQIRNKAKSLVTKALYAFRDLQELRGGAQAALFELSDIPISDWSRYVRRQVEIEENKLR